MTYMLALLLFHVVSAYCFGCHFRISRQLCRLPDPTWRPLVVRNLSNPSVLAVDEQHRRCGPRGCDTFFFNVQSFLFFWQYTSVHSKRTGFGSESFCRFVAGYSLRTRRPTRSGGISCRWLHWIYFWPVSRCVKQHSFLSCSRSQSPASSWSQMVGTQAVQSVSKMFASAIEWHRMSCIGLPLNQLALPLWTSWSFEQGLVEMYDNDWQCMMQIESDWCGATVRT